MFCQKCGNQTQDNSKFCEKCGAKLVVGGEEKVKETTKVEDKEVILNVTSKYKIMYQSIGFIISMACILLLFITGTILSGEVSGFTAIGIILIIMVPIVIIWAISTVIRKIQYNKYTYDFYKTKIIYKDSFLNISEKEVKYKYIREIVFTQSFIQRFFNIGNILLYTNAESGFSNGILIRSVENVKETYNKVKEIINV